MTFHKDKITGALKVSGALDIDGANSLREALLDAFHEDALHQNAPHQQQEVVADLSETHGCDAAVLQVLLACGRDAAAAGKPFRVIASDSVNETATALGLSTGAPGNEMENYRPHAN